MAKFRIEIEVEFPETWTKEEIEEIVLQRLFGIGSIRKGDIKIVKRRV